MKRSWQYRIRKLHRYMGLFIGVQFLFWTAGGLYFSWSNLATIHGDHLKRPVAALSASLSLVSPTVSLKALQQRGIDSVASVQLIELNGHPVYQITYPMQHGAHTRLHAQLADARTGALRPALSQNEAIALARQRFAGMPTIDRVEYLTHTNGHHEYREKPLPAYAVTFRQPVHATVYVAAELGTVQSVRTDPWRLFDFLWMLHTMDYEGRDDINNDLLRAFSILGLLTILSGFALYAVSSPQIRYTTGRRKRVASADV